MNLRNIQPGNIELSQSEINNMPEFGGSSDLIKGLQARPGVKTHSDGSAFYYVRGGEKDQNLIIIDDAPIYNPAHLFGFYSLIIPDFTKSVKLYNSDIPVNLGDRLSSVLDIRTRDGNLKKYELNGATSFIMNRISLEGPIVRDKSSFFTSLRLSNFRWLYKNYTPNLNLSFGDFSFKWNYKFNDRNRFFFTAINGRDLLSNFDNALGSAGIQWNNFAMTLRWNHIFNPKLFSNTILYVKTKEYSIIEKDGLKIGILSANIELNGLVPKKIFKETGYLDPLETSLRVSEKLKLEDKCDFIICLSHLGYKYDGDKISDIKLAQQSQYIDLIAGCLLYTSPSPRDRTRSRMPSSA